MFKIISTIAIAVALTALGALAWLATRPAAPKPFAADYHEALRNHPGSEASIARGLESFASAYANLAHPDIADRIQSLYADPMYFNDSLKTFDRRETLVEYMRATGAMLHNSTVRIDQTIRDGRDIFVRWTMEFSAGAGAQPISSRSVGMTHLRFDDRGRVVLHQDFWDSASGLYRNLPVIGYALEQVDRRMAK
ncbi:MAG: nuclear transport factor 2 family protein [Wenzhouxiangellaceae bacterium]